MNPQAGPVHRPAAGRPSHQPTPPTPPPPTRPTGTTARTIAHYSGLLAPFAPATKRCKPACQQLPSPTAKLPTNNTLTHLGPIQGVAGVSRSPPLRPSTTRPAPGLPTQLLMQRVTHLRAAWLVPWIASVCGPRHDPRPPPPPGQQLASPRIQTRPAPPWPSTAGCWRPLPPR